MNFNLKFLVGVFKIDKMEPQKSYIIWFTQRSGSSLLCKSLEETQLAGRPGELLVLMGEEKSLCDKYNVTTYDELKQKLWEIGTSPNGIFGMKNPLHLSRFEKVIQEIKRLGNFKTNDPMEILSDIFPNCVHIYLGRRNKIRQVVSWWRAIHDNVWHLQKGEKHQNEDKFYEEKYDFDALTHLFKESVLMECSVQRFFDKNQIVPHSIFYEDFIKNYQPTIEGIFDFLKIEKNNLKIQPPFYSKTADVKSDLWVNRFAKEMQENFNEVVF